MSTTIFFVTLPVHSHLLPPVYPCLGPSELKKMDTSIGGFVKNCWDDEEDLAFAKPEPKVATAATKVSVVSGGKPKKSAAKKATTAPPKGGPISGEEKRKREELVQKADYEVAQDLFDSIDDGPRPSTAAEKPPIDPKTEFEFEAFAFHLAQMVTPLSVRLSPTQISLRALPDASARLASTIEPLSSRC